VKRLFFILLFFGCLCFLSCQREYGILDYQKGDLVAECRINGKYTVEISKVGEGCTVTVLEPEHVRGIAFTVGECVSVLAEGKEIQMEREELSGICAIAGIFSQNEDTLISATQKGEGSELTFQTDECVYQITLGKGSLPKKVNILSEKFRYEVEIVSVELK
jgi:hypothetical protein